MSEIRQKVLTVEEIALKLRAIHADVQRQFHDQWDWMNADFYVEALTTHIAKAEEASADHLKELEELRERNRYLLDENDGLESAVSAHEGEAAYALQRSALLAAANVELDALRAQLREKDAALNHAACMDDKHQEESRQLLRSKDEQLAGMRAALALLEKYAPLSGDMALMIRASQPGGEVAHERANKLIEFYSHLDEAHDAARAALSGPSPAQEGTDGNVSL